jgi:hypothetical protein
MTRGRGAVLLLAVAVLVGTAVRFAVERRNTAAMADTFSNFLIAKSIDAGGGFSTGGAEHPDVTRSVMFPLVIAAVAPLAGGVEVAASIVVLLAGAMIVIPLFYTARAMYGPRAALAAIPLGTLSCLVAASATLLPTTLFLFFAMAATALAWSASRRRSLGLWAMTGAASGLAALTRPEGLALTVVLLTWALLARGRGPGRTRRTAWRRVSAAALVVASSALLYAPYVAWASTRLDRFAFAPGIEYLQAMRTVSDHLGFRETRSPIPWTERARFTLTADHRALYLETYFLGGYFPSVDGEVATSPPAERVETRIEHWEGVARRRRNIILGNLFLAPRKALWGHFLTPLIAALTGVGLVSSMSRPRGRQALLLLTLCLIGSLAPLFSHVEARFLFLPYALAMIVAAEGWATIGRLWHARAAAIPWGRPLSLLVHGLMVGLVAVSGFQHEGRDPLAAPRADLLRKAAAELDGVLPPGPVLAIAPQFPYWAERAYRPIPVASANAILDYARAQEATALVLEGERDLTERPDLAWLLAVDRPAAFRLLSQRPHPGGGSLLVYEIREDRP